MALIIHITSSLDRAGAEYVLYHTTIGYQKQGHEQIIITLRNGHYESKLIQSGIKTIKVRHFCMLMYTLYKMIGNYILKKRDGKIVLMGWLWRGNIYTRISGAIMRCCYRKIGVQIRSIITLHHLPSFQGYIKTMIDYYLPCQPDDVIAVSSLVQSHGQLLRLFTRSAWHVIPNGIVPPESRNCWAPADNNRKSTKDDTLRSQKTTHKQQLPSYQAHRLLCVARFIREKRILLVLQAFKIVQSKIPNCILTLIGFGPLESEIKQYIIDHALQHAVLIYQNVDAASFFAQATTYIQCSETEGFSLTVAQALAHQLPTIVTAKQRIHPILMHGINGIIIDTNIPNIIAKEVIVLLQNLYPAKILAHYGRQMVMDQFTITHMQKQYNALLSIYP